MTEFSNEWFMQNQPGFEAAATLAGQIGEQEQLHDELLDNGGIKTEVLRILAEEHLATEQAKTFSALAEANQAVPYQELGEQDVALEAALARVSIRLAGIDESLAPDIKRIEEDRRLLGERIPGLADLSTELAEQSVSELVASAQQPLLAEQRQLFLQQAVVKDFFGQYGAAWPIPQLVNAEQRIALSAPKEPLGVPPQPQEIEPPAATEQPEAVPPPMEPWEAKLRADAAAAIAQLEEWELMEGAEVAWSQVYHRSSSAKVGTNTMLTKAIEGGILAKDQTSRNSVVATQQLIRMLLQGQPVYEAATATKARSKRVPGIVEELVQAYLDAKKSD